MTAAIKFLSTPSVRRATAAALLLLHLHGISIHALREEGDSKNFRTTSSHPTFLSTPSVRRATER